MKVTFNSNYGNFDYQLTSEVPEGTSAAVAQLFQDEGLANLGFRACGSNVEKALVKAGAMGKDDKRIAAEYNEANATTVQKAAQATLDEIVAKKGYPVVSIEVTGQHVFGETEASRKMATEMWAKVAENDALRLALGATEDTTDEEGIELAHKFLGTLRKPRK